MRWAVPDQVIPHQPAGVCSCGADLAEARDVGVARFLPAAGHPRAGRKPSPPRPAHGGVPVRAVSMGLILQAVVVCLLVSQHVPVQPCRQLIEDATGAQVSDGFIHSCLATAAGAGAGVVKLIRTLITAAYVAGFDPAASSFADAKAGPHYPRRMHAVSATS